jgi:hypothetical protein
MGLERYCRTVLAMLSVATAVSLSSCGGSSESNCHPTTNASGIVESNCPNEEAGGGYEGDHRDDRENPLDEFRRYAPPIYKPPPIDKPPPILFK